METAYIRKLIKQGEHQKLDFKFEISDSRKIARTLVAFANTDGGIVLVGVKDNGSIAGIRSEEEYYMIDAAARVYCKPEIVFSTRKWVVEGKTVLEIQINADNENHYYAKTGENKWMAYIRSGDKNILANSVLIKVWKKQKDKSGIFIRFSESERILFQYLNLHEKITLSKFCRIAHISRFPAENILVDMILLELVTIEFTEKQIYYYLTPVGKEQLAG